jgi:hypothetical protein
MSYKEGYFCYECGSVNEPFDKHLWIHVQFMCHFHNINCTVNYNV